MPHQFLWLCCWRCHQIAICPNHKHKQESGTRRLSSGKKYLCDMVYTRYHSAPISCPSISKETIQMPSLKHPLSLQPCYAMISETKTHQTQRGLKGNCNAPHNLNSLLTKHNRFLPQEFIVSWSISWSALLRVLRILLQYWPNRMYPVQQNLLWNVAKNLIIVLVWISSKLSTRLELAHHHTCGTSKRW